jgi:ferredoxin
MLNEFWIYITGFAGKGDIMADKSNRLPQNAKGKWYVDASCIGCGLCSVTAPDIFILGDDGQAYVARQPQTEEENELAIQAMNDCSAQSIGDDGE